MQDGARSNQKNGVRIAWRCIPFSGGTHPGLLTSAEHDELVRFNLFLPGFLTLFFLLSSLSLTRKKIRTESLQPTGLPRRHKTSC